MTVLYPARFAQAAPAGFDGLFDWDFLKGAFGPVIMPMDLDGVVERNGRFLVFETKDSGVKIPKGQEISLKALCATGLFTVFVIYGKTPKTLSRFDEWHRNKVVAHDENVTPESVWQRANDWFIHVNGLQRLTTDDLKQASVGSMSVSLLMDENETLRSKIALANRRIDTLERQLMSMRDNFKLTSKTIGKNGKPPPQLDMFGVA